MPKQTSHFLNIPLELRNNIYSYAIIDHQPEIPCAVPGSTVVFKGRKGASALTQRPRAFLVESCPSDGNGPTLVCSLTLSQVNRQVRLEFSDCLRTAPVDIVSRIRNFDWSHVTLFIRSLPEWRRNQFLVEEDGTAETILYFELGGPYSPDWRTNIMCWIDFVDELAQGANHELKTIHRTSQDPSTVDRRQHAPISEIVCEVYTMYQCQRKGSGGRLDLDKIFYTLLAKHKAEVMLRSGQPTSVTEVFLAQARGILYL